MKSYHRILEKILNEGIPKTNRTGIDTLSCFGIHFRHDLKEGFPLLTTKKLHWHSILYENLWFLHPDEKCSSSNNWLKQNKVSIWDEWANEDGGLGEVYGVQYRHYPTRRGEKIDQIKNLLEKLKTNPNDRRLVVNAWNVDTITSSGNYFSGACALPPCHMNVVFNVSNGKLNAMMTMRSTDVFLGLPYNIAGYGFWICLFAHLTNLERGELVINSGDCHLYTNHLDQAREQITREPYNLPELWIDPNLKELDQIYNEDGSVNSGFFKLLNYNSHPHIKAQVAK